ncbi:DUF4221 family protein [Cyclobacterium plantarum]|uniref:DUF4221 family protein n=1 Tax=Cyclobacterium plantarum TaxID=2716263 RepID=UPI003F719976
MILGCESKKSKDTVSPTGFTYTIDTVVVDPKGHFFDLRSNLYFSDITPDGNYLVNFNNFVFALEYVDLRNLQFARLDSLEVEGPNGVGDNYVSGLKMMENKEVFLSTGRAIAFKRGNELKSIKHETIFKEFSGDSIQPQQIFYETVSEIGSQYAGLLNPPRLDSSPSGVLWADLETRTKHFIPVEEFKEFDKYNIIQYIGEIPVNSFAQAYNLLFFEDKLILTVGLENSAWIIDGEQKSVQQISFESVLLQNTHKVNYPLRVESDVEAEAAEKFKAAVKEKSKQPSYSKWAFDKKRGLFWRFSKAMDHMEGEEIVFKTILTAFDTRFNQVYECQLPEGFSYSDRFFIWDGMIYSLLNMDDEMAFVRLIPELNEIE